MGVVSAGGPSARLTGRGYPVEQLAAGDQFQHDVDVRLGREHLVQVGHWRGRSVERRSGRWRRARAHRWGASRASGCSLRPLSWPGARPSSRCARRPSWRTASACLCPLPASPWRTCPRPACGPARSGPLCAPSRHALLHATQEGVGRGGRAAFEAARRGDARERSLARTRACIDRRHRRPDGRLCSVILLCPVERILCFYPSANLDGTALQKQRLDGGVPTLPC